MASLSAIPIFHHLFPASVSYRNKYSADAVQALWRMFSKYWESIGWFSIRPGFFNTKLRPAFEFVCGISADTINAKMAKNGGIYKERKKLTVRKCSISTIQLCQWTRTFTNKLNVTEFYHHVHCLPYKFCSLYCHHEEKTKRKPRIFSQF